MLQAIYIYIIKKELARTCFSDQYIYVVFRDASTICGRKHFYFFIYFYIFIYIWCGMIEIHLVQDICYL